MSGEVKKIVVRALLSRAWARAPEDILLGLRLYDDLGLDSLAFVEVCMEIEETLNRRIDWSAFGGATVGNLIDFLVHGSAGGHGAGGGGLRRWVPLVEPLWWWDEARIGEG